LLAHRPILQYLNAPNKGHVTQPWFRWFTDRVRPIPVSASIGYRPILGADTSSHVVRLPVSTVNTVATRAYSF